jgi:hypothetical protein
MLRDPLAYYLGPEYLIRAFPGNSSKIRKVSSPILQHLIPEGKDPPRRKPWLAAQWAVSKDGAEWTVGVYFEGLQAWVKLMGIKKNVL